MLNRKLLPVLFAFLIPCFLPAQVTPDEARVNKVFNSLTLEEKANLCQGDPGVERWRPRPAREWGACHGVPGGHRDGFCLES